MQIPFHPLIVHLPVALSLVLPVLILVFAFMIRAKKMTAQAWLVIVGLQVLTTVTGYIAMDSGEAQETKVARVLEKKHIQHHEEVAEIFVGTTVLALVLSAAIFFLRQELQFNLQLGVFALSLVSCYFIFQTGQSGGELVYRYGAARAYVKEPKLETELLAPRLETPVVRDVNESLAPDDNDYGNSDEAVDTEDDDSKQED